MQPKNYLSHSPQKNNGIININTISPNGEVKRGRKIKFKNKSKSKKKAKSLSRSRSKSNKDRVIRKHPMNNQTPNKRSQSESYHFVSSPSPMMNN